MDMVQNNYEYLTSYNYLLRFNTDCYSINGKLYASNFVTLKNNNRFYKIYTNTKGIYFNFNKDRIYINSCDCISQEVL